MKNRLTRNLRYKIIALILAVFTWLAINNVEDPVYTREFSDVPVTEINGEELTDANMAYSYVDGNTVSFRVKGKTSIVNSLTKDDFSAVADLSKLSVTGAVMVDVSCPDYPSLEITPVGSSTMVKIAIEELEEKSFNVSVVKNGSVSEDKYVATGTATPNLITVSGPKSQVDRIKEAVVYINVSGADDLDQVTSTADIALLDSSGDQLDTSSLTLSQSSVDVSVPIYNTKTVPVELDFTGTPADGYTVVSEEYEPKEVTIAGPEEALEKIDSIKLDDIDISGRNKSIEENITTELTSALPEGIVLTNSDTAISAAVDIEKIEEQSIDVTIDDIEVEDGDSSLSYSVASEDDSTDKVSVTLSGASSIVEDITAGELSPTVNVNGYGEGTYSLPVNLTLPDGVTQTNTVNVKVTIKAK